MLTWRRLVRGTARTQIHPVRTATELFVYIVRGTAELVASGTAQRLSAGTLIVIPGAEQRVTMQAVGPADVAVAEFSVERR